MSVFSDLTRAMSSVVLNAFGEPVVFHLEGQAEPLPGRGVFSAAHQEVDASTGVPVSMVQPVLEVRLADLPATPTEGDAVTVRGQRYLIVDVRPDGHGFLKLMLHKGGGHEASSHPDP
ncbi:hypothetical protein [Cupriavidus sp.]|uniref:head-tail joining protein n=1 Tax=Cupriavidus sp. TaxID=1873897 RepID=UPI0025C1BD66|nr:hypothetical protein [Cupriavidus sp.]MCA3195220.1 hypothetical protein [Cupriavidus sp.]